MIRRLLVTAAFAVAALCAAAPAQAQSLEEALVLAYANNPTMLAARAELRSVDEQIAQALSGYRPTLQASGDVGYNTTETDVTSWESSQPSGFDITLNQPLYSGGGTQAATSQADNVILAQRASLTSTEQQVLFNAVTSYMDVVLSRQVLELAVNNEERLTRQLEATEDRFRVGEVTRTDVSQARASLANAQADRLTAEGNVIRTAAAFEEVIGVAPATLSSPGPLIGLPADLEVALAAADEENPAIHTALYNEAAARDGIDVQFADLLPSVGVVAGYEQNYDVNGVFDNQNIAQVLAIVTIPLYQAGFEESQVRSARQTAAQRRMEIDEARRAVQAALVDAWQELATAQAQIVAFTESVNANQIALEGTEREAEVGERTVLDVLDAEQTLFQSQIDLAVAMRDEVVASYGLQSAIGRLTAANLSLPVEIYDPVLNYDKTRSDWGFGGLFDGGSEEPMADPMATEVAE